MRKGLIFRRNRAFLLTAVALLVTLAYAAVRGRERLRSEEEVARMEEEYWKLQTIACDNVGELRVANVQATGQGE